MNDDLISIVDLEAQHLDHMLRSHPPLAPLFAAAADRQPAADHACKQAYLRLLKVTADYVTYTVPMLRAAGEALRNGDDEDRAWSERFLAYSHGETDSERNYGHQVWARDDMKALGASDAFVDATIHASVGEYARFFVEQARLHPYAILGAKGVLEHLSIRVSDDLVAGVRARIPGGADAVTFFGHHGVLDIEHVRDGDRNLSRLQGQGKRHQVLTGAYFTSGSYRAFIRFCVADS